MSAWIGWRKIFLSQNSLCTGMKEIGNAHRVAWLTKVLKLILLRIIHECIYIKLLTSSNITRKTLVFWKLLMLQCHQLRRMKVMIAACQWMLLMESQTLTLVPSLILDRFGQVFLQVTNWFLKFEFKPRLFQLINYKIMIYLY